jgi:hypothetical protein
MDNHIPYEQIRKQPCDFIVKYRFYTEKEGGRKTGTPEQGYRSDFMYAEDDGQKRIWMIHPEFLDENGKVIIDKTIHVPETGQAQMWIINERFYDLHKQRITIGQKGFFMEGGTKMAECEVIAIVNLANYTSA